MHEYIIKNLVLKVTSSCNAQCYHCRERQNFYHLQEEKFKELPIETITHALEYSLERNLEKVTISGGEPTLVHGLQDIIKLVSACCQKITLITNGWNSNKLYWCNLIKHGLTHVDISLDGYNASLHDWLRNKKGLFACIQKSLKVFKELKKEYKNFDYSIITMVSTFNILNLHTVLELIIESDVSRWVLHYPEADMDAVFSPSKYKQKKFRSEILPLMLDLLRKNSTSPELLNNQRTILKRIYNPKILDPSLSARGIYHSEEDAANLCKVPRNFLLVKCDGTLLACNGGEYCDDAIIGKVNDSGLLIFDDDKIKGFDKKRMNYCRFCPIPNNLRLLLR